jgi:hypothetical protein
MNKFPLQHGCWRAWLLSIQRKKNLKSKKHIVFPSIEYVHQLYKHVSTSNRACAWTCEVMECMLLSNEYIIAAQVHVPAQVLVCMAASTIQKHALCVT